jgi:hypothetical protein
MWGILEKKKKKKKISQNCRIATIWKFGGGGGGIKCHVLNIRSQSVNVWIVQGVKCIFPKILIVRTLGLYL